MNIRGYTRKTIYSALADLSALVEDILSDHPHSKSLQEAETAAMDLIKCLHLEKRAYYVEAVMKRHSRLLTPPTAGETT